MKKFLKLKEKEMMYVINEKYSDSDSNDEYMLSSIDKLLVIILKLNLIMIPTVLMAILIRVLMKYP